MTGHVPVTTNVTGLGLGRMDLTKATVHAVGRSVLRWRGKRGVAPNHGQGSSQNSGGK